MARGPKPQAAAVREQKEPVRSPHRSRPAAPEMASSAGTLQPPAWLKKDGLKIWQRLAPTLRSAKLLTQADVETFGRYCRNFARWLKMNAIIDKEGETYETETYGAEGTRGAKLKRVNPAYLIADRIERQLLAAEDRFGLNPAERQRIFIARAAGAPADLFGTPQPERRQDDAASHPTQPAEPEQGPVGFLN